MKELIGTLMDNVATGLISLAAAYLTYYIRQSAKNLKAEIEERCDSKKRELFNTAVDRISSLAEVTVAAMEQTTAETLRKAVKSGEADKQLLIDLGTDAVLQVKEQLSEKYKRVITDECGDLDTYITNVVESKVYELKQK